MYLAKIAVTEFEDDTEKIGWLRVWYKRELRWAMPKMRFGAFEMPTREWLTKYGDCLGVWIVGQKMHDEREHEAYLVWDGFCFLEGKVPAEALTNYPYVRLFFTENWKMSFDDTVNANVFKLVHVDGTSIVIDRTVGSENVIITDSKVGNSQSWSKSGMSWKDCFGNAITTDSTGIKINGQYVVLKPALDWILHNAAAFVMGNLGVPAPILPNVVELANTGMEQSNDFVSNIVGE